jgi:hypothetical protein
MQQMVQGIDSMKIQLISSSLLFGKWKMSAKVWLAK